MTIPQSLRNGPACLPRIFRPLSCIGAGLLLAAQPAEASEPYPNRPIRVIVGMPAGGATDVLARALAEKMGPALGQTMVVDNRPGAGAIIGTNALAKSAPDGYTISVLLSSAVIGNQFVYRKLPYNPDTDIAFIYQLVDAATVLVADASQPFRTAKEFADYAGSRSGKLTYGSFSNGSYGHVAMAYMDERLKSKMTHVAYKGEPPMLQDMLGGLVHVAFGSVAATAPHVQSGRLRYLGVTGPRRMSALPDVPTLAEQGLDDAPFKLFGWLGMVAPAGTPKPIIDRLAAEVSRAMKDPEVQERVRGLGFEPVVDSTPEKTLARYHQDLPLWKRLIEQAGAREP
jgi:tripartite-type tricarboxylate transporter receptor subunit TctC